MSDLLDRFNDIRSTSRPRPSFTLEPGHGETYRPARPVLYAHSVDQRSSVLAGQPRRLWVAEWDTWDEAGPPCPRSASPTARSSSTISARAAV